MLFPQKVGENRYRARYGRYFEEFNIGDIYEHRPGRTITDADNIQARRLPTWAGKTLR